ncbi:unnamed protein product [Mucor fragilis]
MSQLSSRETSDMEIDDEALDQSKLHTYSYLLLTSDSDTVSVKSVDYSTVDAKDSQEYNTADEKNYLYEELYGDDDASEASSAINKSNAYTEESLIEDMSIDGERDKGECQPHRASIYH